MTTQGQTTKEDLLHEARNFISNLGLMVASVHQRHVAPIKALTAIDEFMARMKSVNEPDTFAPFERTCLRARAAVEVVHKSLN
jgi:hypothetical protein